MSQCSVPQDGSAAVNSCTSSSWNKRKSWAVSSGRDGEPGEIISVKGLCAKQMCRTVSTKDLWVLQTHDRFSPSRDVVEVLLRNDALTNVADSKGCYPLHLAAWKGDAQIVRLLIHQGPSHTKVNEQVGGKGSFLHSATARPWQPHHRLSPVTQISGNQLFPGLRVIPLFPALLLLVRQGNLVPWRVHFICIWIMQIWNSTVTKL